MKKKISILCFVLLLAILSAGAAFAQTNAVVIKPTVNLYKKPNAKTKAAETLKQGRKLKLESTKPIRGWYKVTVISDTEPQNADEEFENYLSQYRTYWIQGNDIKIEKDLPVKDDTEPKDEWIEFARAKENIFSYNPARVTSRGALIQTWTEGRDEDDELLSKNLYEIDCQSSKLRSLAGIEYTRYEVETYPDGKTEKIFVEPTSSSWDTPNSKFTIIFPDSIGEALFKTVCKK